MVGLFLGLSALTGLLVDGRPVSDLLAGALVAFAVLPLRDKLQRSVNARLIGDRDDPYAAISRADRAAGRRRRNRRRPAGGRPDGVGVVAHRAQAIVRAREAGLGLTPLHRDQHLV